MISFWVRIEKFLNYALVFLLPTQLALHFWPDFAFVYGIRVDYLAPSIYLTDILFLMVFLIWIRGNCNKFLKLIEKNKGYILLFLLVAILNTAFSTSVFPSIYKWIKLLELGLFYLYIRARSDFFNSKTLFNTFYYSLVLFSVIGILQFGLGRTLGGLMYFLGERSFNISTPGIALTQIVGQSYMRAYSTFSHPNSFAGYLGLGIIVLLSHYSKNVLIKKLWGILIICLAFLLTFSLSAVIGIIVCAALYLFVNKKFIKTKYFIFFPATLLLISLTLPFISTIALNGKSSFSESVGKRLDLSFAAGSMVSSKFLLGEGLNTFVINEPKIRYSGISSWTLQPVHNIFLLVFSETGIVGLSFFYFLLMKLTKGVLQLGGTALCLSVVFILTSGLFDHYWFTLQQNMFLAVLILGISFREKR